jgi:hypothetical protein
MVIRMKSALALAVFTFAFFGAAPRADALVILTMGQSGQGTTISGVNNGAGSTTITGTNVAISVTQIDPSAVALVPPTPFAAFLNLSATNTGAATLVAGNVVQDFGGNFQITSGLGGTGTNYLSGTFSDAVFGAAGGSALTMSAAQPPDFLTFTSDVILSGALDQPRGLSLSFAGVDPPVGITNNSLSSFSSSVSGTFNAAGTPVVVPAPAALPLLLAGAPLLGLAGWRKWRKRA